MPSTNPSLLDFLKTKLTDAPLPWGVGYSGGRDSGVLLWALSQLAPPGGVVALYVDHGWRSDDEREAEARVVAQWCGRLGAVLRSFPPPASPVRTEAAAREHRYACFESFAAEHPGSPVFLAHHADDQAETVLMRILKGRSWRGLGGMAERRGPYWRPLLGVRASVLADTAREQGIPWHEDSTNASDRWTRNQLRLAVFPLLTERFPRAVEAINSLAEAWRLRAPRGELDSRWAFEAQAAVLPSAVWDGWDALERQVQLEAAAQALGFARPPSRRLLETVSRSKPVSGAGWSLSRTAQSVVWQRVAQVSAMEYFVQAAPDRDYDLGGYRFRWSPRPADGALAVPADASLPVVWRSAVPGMVFASDDDADWGKEKRRRRLGGLGPERCALVMQGGLILAVIDPTARAVSWSREPEKLNKTLIFVTLEPRSKYER